MKKPYKEEKPGLKIEIKSVNIILLALFLSQEIFPQIPINGFCKYRDFEVDSGYTSLFTLNYNDDSYTDIVLFNSNTKKIVSIKGLVGGSFGVPVVSNLPYQITNIQNLIEKNKKVKRYAFVSRESRRAGIYSFSANGHAVLSGTIRFKSFPENLSTADVDQNGRDEILVSGSAFNGLSIITQTSRGLNEKKIVEKTSFTNAVFADLRNDGFSDIAAFNPINNSLFFFYNNGNGQFSMVRTISLDSPIHSLKAADLNLDNYTDLIYASGKTITIMYGDFASAYNNIVNIPTEYAPDKIITGDFNKDGKIDIAYVNYEENILSILYAKDDGTFYREMIYLRKKDIKSLVPYYSKFINGIAVLGSDGYLYTLTNLSSLLSDVSIAFSPDPGAITFFDLNNNGITDICYIDSFTKSLNLIVRNNAGIPSFYYSYPLYENHKKILVNNSKPKEKIFYCFSPGKKLIEILKINFNNNSIDRNSIYSPGRILDLKIQENPEFIDNIFIAYEKNYILGLDKVEYRDFRYLFTNYSYIAPNPLSADISFDKSLNLIYWYKNENKLMFSKTTFIGGVKDYETKSILPINQVNGVISFTGDLLNNETDITINFLREKKLNKALIFNSNSQVQFKTKELPDYFGVYSPEQLFFGPIRLNGIKKLCVYMPERKSIEKIDFINRGKDFIISKIINAENIQSYFFKNMNYSGYNLVYVDSLTNCIKIQQL